jgi:hypothetical protein
MREHSPLPWMAETYGENEVGIGLISMKEGRIIPSNGLVAWVTLFPSEVDANDPSRAEANAALIVRAVNNHQALVEALKDILARAQFELDHPSEMRDTAFSIILKNADAVLSSLKDGSHA